MHGPRAGDARRDRSTTTAAIRPRNRRSPRRRPCPVSEAAGPRAGQREGGGRRRRRSRSRGRRASSQLAYHPNMKVESTTASRSLVTRPDDERAEPGPARPDPQPDHQHGGGRHRRATRRSSKIEGVGYQAAARRARRVELTVGYANRSSSTPPEGVTVAVPDPTHDRRHRRGQAGGRPVRRRDPRSAASPSRTRARASATRARSSAARKASRSPPGK